MALIWGVLAPSSSGHLIIIVKTNTHGGGGDLSSAAGTRAPRVFELKNQTDNSTEGSAGSATHTETVTVFLKI